MRTLILETFLCVATISPYALGFVGEHGNTKRANANEKIQTRRSIDEKCEPEAAHGMASPTRRTALEKMTAMTIIGTTLPKVALAATSRETLIPSPAFTSDLSWPLGKIAFSLLPLAGTSSRRATVEECIVPDTIWTHDQIQGVVNVNVPVRQTVIRLKRGGLWIHNPVGT